MLSKSFIDMIGYSLIADNKLNWLFRFVYMDSIPLIACGKHQFLIKKLPITIVKKIPTQ
jgi:hypothetical protein